MSLLGSVGQPLVLGVNTLTAPASTWNRYVKAQFQNNTFEFDAISINGNSVYSSSNTSFTGLTPQTQYDVYVQSDCGSGGISSWVGPLTFTTACGAAASPYLENFDAGFPFCWSQSTTDDFNWTLNSCEQLHLVLLDHQMMLMVVEIICLLKLLQV